MSWFANLPVRGKILSVAGLGLGAFLVYFLYSFVIAERNIEALRQIEEQDYVLLESSVRTGVSVVSARDALTRAVTGGAEEAVADAARFAQRARQGMRAMMDVDQEVATDVALMLAAFDAWFDYGLRLARDVLDESVAAGTLARRLEQLDALRLEFEGIQDAFQRDRYQEFQNNLNRTRADAASTLWAGAALGALALLIGLYITLRVTRGIIRPLAHAVEVSASIAEGDWDREISVDSRDETGQLLRAIRRMRDTLKARRDADLLDEQRKTHIAELHERMRGEHSVQELGEQVLDYLVPALGAQVGAFYVFEQDERLLRLLSSHALSRRRNLSSEFALGQSLVGQCALERRQIVLQNVPEDYMPVASGTGSAAPRFVVVTPIVLDDELKGVLEIATLRDFDDNALRLLEEAVRVVAVALHTAQSRVRLASMLEQTRRQAEELEKQKAELSSANADLEEQAMELVASEQRLQQQQEELRAINEELEAQTQALRASEESLQAQQEELRVTNEELEAQARLLTEQKAEMAAKNAELERLKLELEEKVRELELSSKYKSEFLSTMSHELRTPLNSILILSSSLAQNKKGNLEPKQVEHAQVIHSAGSDLLALINDILDISKIEEGKMDVVIDDIDVPELEEHFRKHFAHIAESRGLYFRVEMGENLPAKLYTDRHRMEQVLKNLLSNAMKFTEEGGVTLRVDVPDADALPSSQLTPGRTLRFSVIDTGIGIPQDKQKLIFEAFQQADGTTSRKYGGTGLGLTISRELSRLLGGDVGLFSEGPGKGSTFMLFLPFGSPDAVQPDSAQHEPAAPEPVIVPAGESAASVVVREKTVLIVEDDAEFARVLVELAEDYGLEGHVCPDGETGLEFARQYRPSAIILDIGLPGMDGWEVMEKLKQDPRTKDIPVHFLSGKDERKKALALGAVDFLTKPVSADQLAQAFNKIETAIAKNVRRMLVVEDSELQHEGIRELFDQRGVEITPACSGREALAALSEQVFDCMILDLTLPDMSGLELLEKLDEEDICDSLPVIIYTGKELSREEEARLRKYADRIILKTERSSERLLNEASLFLHWLESTLPASSKPSAELLEHRDDIFEGKKLLLVDDDMRNIYALSAQLEELGFDIEIANNGREAVEALERQPDMDIVLMDIMMPEMDGYEAMAHIRRQPRFQKLPILALTAKAMKDDRAKCLEAGANDYCSKPIDMGRLTSLMRVWLHK